MLGKLEICYVEKLGQRLIVGGISKLRILCQGISNNYKYVLNLLALCLILRKNKEFAALKDFLKINFKYLAYSLIRNKRF